MFNQIELYVYVWPCVDKRKFDINSNLCSQFFRYRTLSSQYLQKTIIAARNTNFNPSHELCPTWTKLFWCLNQTIYKIKKQRAAWSKHLSHYHMIFVVAVTSYCVSQPARLYRRVFLAAKQKQKYLLSLGCDQIHFGWYWMKNCAKGLFLNENKILSIC